ncbi:SixA phosphatase family protein [Sediminicola luteus]|uniref:Histidine phosphatase family protein n=1 Tax=Sediminicola luteus TaxID=319238 RepID=A0A2A4GAK7_9FLAO|nr:histidine phosphatase family protein [Sediminicola luteus]PCE65010.1 histidine phosphatase family protein [Sediminicola luteus]
MPKTLYFIRHGKSSWEHQVSDRERPLKSRGTNDARLIGSWLRENNIQPDAVYTSPAKRAQATSVLVSHEMGYSADKIELVEDLYDFSGESVHRFIKSLNDNLHTVFIFGHNYAFTNLVNFFGSRSIENLPTAGLARITFSQDQWAEVSEGKTTKLLFPKELKA